MRYRNQTNHDMNIYTLYIYIFIYILLIASLLYRAQLFFSFAFCLQGESKICMTVDVKHLPGVRHLVPSDLTCAAAVQGDFKGKI